jgi:hypothetical protein
MLPWYAALICGLDMQPWPAAMLCSPTILSYSAMLWRSPILPCCVALYCWWSELPSYAARHFGAAITA